MCYKSIPNQIINPIINHITMKKKVSTFLLMAFTMGLLTTVTTSCATPAVKKPDIKKPHQTQGSNSNVSIIQSEEVGPSQSMLMAPRTDSVTVSTADSANVARPTPANSL